MKPVTRRRLLASSAIGSLGLAGCSGWGVQDEDEAGTDDNTTGADERDETNRESSDEGKESDDTDAGDEPAETDAIDELVWQSEPGGRAVTVHDGVLYGLEDFREGNGGVVALEAASGDRKWSYGETGELSAYTPPVVDDAVYFGLGDDAIGSGGGKLYALEFDGSERFTADVGSVYEQPRLADGALFVGTDDGRAYAFEVEDGTERWSVEFGDDARLNIPIVEAVREGVVYVSVSGTIYALDAESATERWQYDTRENFPSVRVDDGVYVATSDTLVAVDDGDERWAIELDASKRIAGIADETLFVVRGDDLVAFDTADGTERWRDESDTDRRVRVTDDAIYYSDDGSTTLRATDLEGDERWTATLEGSEIDRIRPTDEAVYAATDAAVHRLDRVGEVVSTAQLEGAGRLVIDDRVYTARQDAFYALDL